MRNESSHNCWILIIFSKGERKGEKKKDGHTHPLHTSFIVSGMCSWHAENRLTPSFLLAGNSCRYSRLTTALHTIEVYGKCRPKSLWSWMSGVTLPTLQSALPNSSFEISIENWLTFLSILVWLVREKLITVQLNLLEIFFDSWIEFCPLPSPVIETLIFSVLLSACLISLVFSSLQKRKGEVFDSRMLQRNSLS